MPVYFRTPSQRKIRKMTARQRKKFHLGEFARLDFGVAGNLLPQHHTSEYFDHFIQKGHNKSLRNARPINRNGQKVRISYVIRDNEIIILKIEAKQ